MNTIKVPNKSYPKRQLFNDSLQLEAQLLDSVTDPILVRDLHGDFVYVNETACKSLGYTKEEFLTMNLNQIVAPEYSVNLEERTMEIVQKGQQNIETANIRKDGTSILAEIHARVIESDGEIYILSVIHDITERKKTEEEFRAHLLDCASEPIVLCDMEGNFHYINEAALKLHGYTRNEMMKLQMTELIPAHEVDLFEPVRQCLLDKGQYTYESLRTRKDGSIFPVDIHSSLFEVEGKNLIFSMYRDITKRKRAEEERDRLFNDLKKINDKLEESNKELQDFAYIASHDLREPLRKIASFGKILESSLANKLDEDQKENLGFMINGASRMQNMIESLLTYSRITTRAKPFEQVDLNKVIEDVTKLELSLRLEETKGTIKVPEKLPFIYGDQSQIRQVFHNLIHNGLKFHRDGIQPEIIVQAQQIEKNMVLIKILDNGIGIDELYFDQLFNMFKRLNSRAQFEGSGIGLASCKKIIKRHGGEIGIESKVGTGSTFWFTLPGGSYVKN
jgi:PAS domain S-box-containing protein